MPPKGHAILSASSSDRWLHCPPSARLCETYEDKGSNYAAEGSDAHSLCEYKLRKALGMEATGPTKNLDWYNAEMDDCATGYVCFIMELLEELKEKHGLSFIFICHNLALVQMFCDRVLVLYEGKVVESGLPDDIINEPKQAYTRKLVDAVFL